MKRAESLLLGTVLLAGLTSMAGDKPSPEPKQEKAEPRPGSGPTHAQAGRQQLPQGLEDVEERAEDAYDHALAGDVAKLGKDAANLKAQWQQVRATVAAAGATPTAITALDGALQDFSTAVAKPGERLALARSANALSAPLSELFRPFSSPIPPEVLALDYLGREEVLDAREGDFSRAASQLDTLEHTWAGLKSQVLAAGGQTPATKFEAKLGEQRAAITQRDAKALEAQANQALELVDDLEKVFKK